MTTLTPELRKEIEKAGGKPIRLEDPETRTAYVLLKAEEYDRLKPDVPCEDVPTEQVPEGIRRSKEAFLRELPGLLARKRLHGRWVIYHGDVQVAISRRPDKVLRKAHQLGLKNDQFYFGKVEPYSPEPEEIEHSLFEYEEFDPIS
jgi:hypothetical protein